MNTEASYPQPGDGLHNTPHTKLRWLHSQLVGSAADFTSPFGVRRITYADTTASGQSLLYIENYILRHVLPFYGNTHTSASHVGQRTTRMVKEGSSYIKRCLGGGDDDALLFCGYGSTAAIKRLQEVMGIAIPTTLRDRVLVQSSFLRVEERWLVFVGPHEHHSNLLSWRRSLAEVVEVGMTEDGVLDMEGLRGHLERHKDDNRPMLGSFSACSNVTGVCSDTRAIATLLHRYGAFACFDFAASGPHVEIRMKSGEVEGYDAIFLSPHKFLGGPGSPGILLMNKALYRINSGCPSTCGGGTVLYVNGFCEQDTLYHEDVEERECAGTPPITQIIRAALGFWVKEYIGHKLIQETEQNYIQTAITRLAQNQNIEILGNTRILRQAILSFMVYPTPKKKPLHGPFVAKLLNDLFGIQARGGCACAGPYAHILLNVDYGSSITLRSYIQQGYHGLKPGWTRVSFSFYMSNEEFNFILDAIEFVGNYGQRFLQLYRFDLKTGDWSCESDRWISEALQAFFKFKKHNKGKNSNYDSKNDQTGKKDTPFARHWGFGTLKDIGLKRSKSIAKRRRDEGVNGEISDEDLGGEMTQTRELYKEVAMYLASKLAMIPEQQVGMDLDLDLLFMV